MDTDQLYEECPRCKGYGSVAITNSWTILVVKPCAKCDGEGVIPHRC